MSFVVIEPGLATTVQDGGRPGYAHLGVTGSGCVDPGLAAALNRLVGNPPDAAVIETVGGFVAEAAASLTIASDQELAPRRVAQGERFGIAAGGDRQWHYLAVAGGIEGSPLLGSVSHDTLSGLVACPIDVGSRVAIGSSGAVGIVDAAPRRREPSVARLFPGPRSDWFDGADAQLGRVAWAIGSSSRVGVRLVGVALDRRPDFVGIELPSEGLVRGAIQVPPDGQPVMMSADHPTTGGYPVVAVVHPDDVAIVAQCPPGGEVRFDVRPRR